MEQSASLTFIEMNKRLGLGAFACHLLQLCLEALRRRHESRLFRVFRRRLLFRRS